MVLGGPSPAHLPGLLDALAERAADKLALRVAEQRAGRLVDHADGAVVHHHERIAHRGHDGLHVVTLTPYLLRRPLEVAGDGPDGATQAQTSRRTEKDEQSHGEPRVGLRPGGRGVDVPARRRGLLARHLERAIDQLHVGLPGGQVLLEVDLLRSAKVARDEHQQGVFDAAGNLLVVCAQPGEQGPQIVSAGCALRRAEMIISARARRAPRLPGLAAGGIEQKLADGVASPEIVRAQAAH